MGGQKYQNKHAFKVNKYQAGNQAKRVHTNSTVIFCCFKCTSVIEWKQKYGKYKALTQPAKCVDCGEKTITRAYHVRCGPCVRSSKKCAKCGEQKDEFVNTPAPTKEEMDKKDNDFQNDLKMLPERKRRTLMRYLAKLEDTEDPDGTSAADKVAEFKERYAKNGG